MTTLREAAQMALQALQESKPIDIDDPAAFYRSAHAIEALRVALANEFNPDWDAMAVMVEEQQRMAKRIEELESALAQPEQEELGEIVPADEEQLKRIAKLVEQEPVAQVDYNERGNISWLFGPQLPDKTFLYTAPPQREWCQCKDAPNDCTYENNCRVPQIDAAFKRIEWQGLTDEDYEAMAEKYVTNCYFDTLKYARAIEAKLKERNYG